MEVHYLSVATSGTAYVCGALDGAPLPPSVAEVETDEEELAKLRSQCNALSPALQAGEIVKEQCCYLPMSPRVLPIIGELAPSIYVATKYARSKACNATS